MIVKSFDRIVIVCIGIPVRLVVRMIQSPVVRTGEKENAMFVEIRISLYPLCMHSLIPCVLMSRPFDY